MSQPPPEKKNNPYSYYFHQILKAKVAKRAANKAITTMKWTIGMTPSPEPRIDPISAVRTADLIIDAPNHITIVGPQVASTSGFYPSRLEENLPAICRTHGWNDKHIAPEYQCQCGYFSWKPELDKVHMNAGLAHLDVDLYGRVIEHKLGYRAQHQRIMSIHYLGRCSACINKITDDDKTYLATDASFTLAIICDKCAYYRKETLNTVFSFSEVRNLLGIELATFTSDDKYCYCANDSHQGRLTNTSTSGSPAITGPTCHVRFGVYNQPSSHVGQTVAQIRHAYSKLWGIPNDAEAYLGGTKLPATYVIKDGDNIEFHRRAARGNISAYGSWTSTPPQDTNISYFNKFKGAARSFSGPPMDGMTLGTVYDSLKHSWELPSTFKAEVNGTLETTTYVIQSGDTIIFKD